MKQPLVSIITLVRNKSEFTKLYIEQLVKNTEWDFELIIVDNASTDDTVDWLKTKAPKMKGTLIQNKENKSFSEANNLAVKIAKGDFICLVNNDIVPTKGWLSAMMNTILSDEKIGVVGAKLLFPGEGTIQHDGVVEEDLRPAHRHFKKPAYYKKANIREDIFAVTGATLLTRKQLYEKVGGLDERYIYGFEDIDFCQKITKAGYRIVYEPTAVLYHYESRTPGRYTFDDYNMNIYLNKWVYNNKKYGY